MAAAEPTPTASAATASAPTVFAFFHGPQALYVLFASGMTIATNREVVETERKLRGEYEWQSPAGKPRIFIAQSVMREIRAHVIAGYKSLPKRGAEVGGVLLGSVDTANGDIAIDEFEPVEIEHLSGPSYTLSDTDYARWHDWIMALRQASPRLVGICRSHTRPGLRVAPEDTIMIRQLLAGEDGTLLLVKPLSDRECVGAFFPFFQGVILDGATPSREFPFGAAAMSRSQYEPAEPPKKRTPLSRWIPITAVAAGIAAGAALHYISESPAENPVRQTTAAAATGSPPAPDPAPVINSSSDRSTTKPVTVPPASAATGDRESVHVRVPAPPIEDSSGLGIQLQNPGRFRRLINGVTTKASHLWPFHSDKPEPPTQ